MSDEQQRRGDAVPEPDETRVFDPSAAPQNQPDGGPRSGDAWRLDHTEQMPRTGDETVLTPRASGDETVLAPRADATSIMPPVDQDPGRAEAAARAAAGRDDALWSGRAEVRPPRPGQGGDYVGDFPGDWDGAPPTREPRGKWWLPIVIGIAVLLLLALLGVGVWLIVRSSGSDEDSPSPAVTTTATTEPTTEPTTTAPTTEPTTTQATTEPTGPAEVTIPALKGLSSNDARQALDRTGLSYRLRFVTSDDADPGTVIDSDPGEGQQVPSDTTVTLIIAAAPSSSPTPTTTTPGTTTPTDTDDQDGN
jgi:hypothetical protein